MGLLRNELKRANLTYHTDQGHVHEVSVTRFIRRDPRRAGVERELWRITQNFRVPEVGRAGKALMVDNREPIFALNGQVYAPVHGLRSEHRVNWNLPTHPRAREALRQKSPQPISANNRVAWVDGRH